MSTVFRAGARHVLRQQVDPTRYAFSCLACTWQLQAGKRALRQFDNDRRKLMMTMAEAHREHIAAEHPEGTGDLVEWADGSMHAGASNTQGALMATRLPEWWEDWL